MAHGAKPQAYYNEIDPYAAQWLRNLIAAGHIAPGIVDERPIQEIEPYELVGFTQCHFFAGIGIWSLALRRAGWPDGSEIWTGSCPCQPFSAAGQQKGFDDARHLWPVWERLIAERRPPVVLGEQVASKDGLQWLDLVHSQMERAGYAFGVADLCAAGFGQAHIRQRLYFVGLADTDDERSQGRRRVSERADQCVAGSGGMAGGLGNPDLLGSGRDCGAVNRTQAPIDGERFDLNGAVGDGRELASATGGLADDQCVGREMAVFDGRSGWQESAVGETNVRGVRSAFGGLADTLPTGRTERWAQSGNGPVAGSRADDRLEYPDLSSEHGRAPSREQPLRDLGDRPDENPAIRNPGQIAERWLDVDWLLCRNPAGEPSWRPVESGTFPLHHGVPNRMGKLRAYGNALDAETATGFVRAVMESLDDMSIL